MSTRERLTPRWEAGGGSPPGFSVLTRLVGAAFKMTGRLSPALATWLQGMRPEMRLRWGGMEFVVAQEGVEAAARPGEGWGDNPRHNYVDRVQDRHESPLQSSPERGASASPSPEPVSSVSPVSLTPAVPPASAPVAPSIPSGSIHGEVSRSISEEFNSLSSAVSVSSAPSPVSGIRPTPSPRPRKKASKPPPAPLFITPDEGTGRELPGGPPSFDRSSLEADVATRMGKKPESEAVTVTEPVPRQSSEELQTELSRIRDILQNLDDVQDFELIKSLDGELYQLHRAVEYKMRTHKASEAKAELGKLFKM